jgi:uncharacterized membrane protein YhaH (DUF805 family)
MTFIESITTCFQKYAEFTGRATRSEFWWWALFVFLLSMCAQMLSNALGTIVSVVTLLPSIAVTTRRLHDIGRSGWWQLVGLIPLIGWVVMVFWCIKESTGPNDYSY